MNRYDSYKDSGVEWLGEVPSHWEVKRIKYLFKIGRGRVISQQELEDNGKYPVYSSQTLDNGILGYISTYDFDCNQLTWTTDGANAGTIFLRKGKHSCTNVCGTLQPFRNECLEFIYYSLGISSQFYKRPDTNGAKIMNGEMADIFISYPPLSEQTAIAQYLDNKTAKIDRAIELEQQQIELLKEYKQIMIQTAVTRGLNPDVALKDSGVEWLGEVPEHWEVKKLKYVLELSNKKEESQNSDKRYIGMENVESFTGKINEIILTAEGISNSFFKDEILFGKLRPYLAKSYLAEFNGICSTEFLVYKASKEIYNRFALNIFLSYGFIDTVNSSTYGSKMPRANSEFIANMLLAIPPLSEQTAIAQYLDEQTAKIDRAIGIKTAQIDKLKEYKTVLINEVVTGKRCVVPN